jgi:hypothetical protein
MLGTPSKKRNDLSTNNKTAELSKIHGASLNPGKSDLALIF